VLDWLDQHRPDVLCMQETKVVDDDFPTEEFLRRGYMVAMSGQKTYNGVAIAARLAMKDVATGLWDEPNEKEKRVLRATVDGIRVVCVYVTNGKSPTHPSFKDKLRFFEGLARTAREEGAATRDLVVCGDFNVAPDERDLYDPEAFRGQLHFHPDEHRALSELVATGLTDVFRLHHDEAGKYSWWDYRGGGFDRDQGLRIDLVFASKSLAKRCTACDIDVGPRRGDKASDHTPVVATFE
jgi:exodeoxyribonuclease-3